MKASKETAMLLVFISNASYTDIEYVHIRLVVICRGYKVGDQTSIVPVHLIHPEPAGRDMHVGTNKEEFPALALQFLSLHGGLQKHDGTANRTPILSCVPHPLLQRHTRRPKEPAQHRSLSPGSMLLGVCLRPADPAGKSS